MNHWGKYVYYVYSLDFVCSLKIKYLWFKWKMKTTEVIHKDKSITKKMYQMKKLSSLKLYSGCSNNSYLKLSQEIQPEISALNLIIDPIIIK